MEDQSVDQKLGKAASAVEFWDVRCVTSASLQCDCVVRVEEADSVLLRTSCEGPLGAVSVGKDSSSNEAVDTFTPLT